MQEKPLSPQEILAGMVEQLRSLALEEGYSLAHLPAQTLENICMAADGNIVSGLCDVQLTNLLVALWWRRNGRKVW